LLKRSFFLRLAQRGLHVGSKVIFQINLAGDDRALFFKQHEQLSALAAKDTDKPKFIFAHILSPHPPYLFTPDGNVTGYVPADTNDGLPRRDKMVNQLQYVNTQILRLVQGIKKSSKTEPVIILQSDEGPYPLELPVDWRKADPETIRSKMGVLAAYYMPEIPEEEYKDLSTNVNAFRFVLNQYFGGQLTYLPDCQFVFNQNAPYEYVNVTSIVQSDPGKKQACSQ